MDYIFLIISFVFGAIIGSFLNVVSLRFNTGAGIGGRSKCMTCSKTLTWIELIPIFSFIFLGGACKKCKSKISWQYPLVEFMAGVVFVLIFLYFPPLTPVMAIRTLIYIVASCLLFIIASYDVKHKIIPDQFSYVFAAIAFLSIFLGGETWFHIPHWSAIIAGPILALPFYLLWKLSDGTWMGLGDAKLMLGIGWILGINGGLNAVVLAFWIAAIASLAWMFSTYGKFKAKTEIPFGPYLIIGMYLVLFFDVIVIDLSLIQVLTMSYF